MAAPIHCKDFVNIVAVNIGRLRGIEAVLFLDDPSAIVEVQSGYSCADWAGDLQDPAAKGVVLILPNDPRIGVASDVCQSILCIVGVRRGGVILLAAIVLSVWKKGARFDPGELKQQAA